MLTLLFLACALTADGLAVSVCRAAGTDHGWRMAFWNGFVFGITHAVMLGLGNIVGELLVNWKAATPWITMIVLLFLGLKMLTEACGVPDDTKPIQDPQGPLQTLTGLLVPATVTSVDCMAAGVGLATLHIGVIPAVIVVGLVTMLACGLGYRLGGIMGDRLGKGAEIAGGVILIMLAIRAILYP